MLKGLAYGDYPGEWILVIYMVLCMFAKEKAESKGHQKTAKILAVFAYGPIVLFTAWIVLLFMYSILRGVWSFILLIFN